MKTLTTIIATLLLTMSAFASTGKGPCSELKLRKKYHVYSTDLEMRIGVVKLGKNKKFANEPIDAFTRVPLGIILGLAVFGMEEDDLPKISSIIKAEEGDQCFLDIQFENSNEYERFEFKADKKKASVIEIMEVDSNNPLLRLQSSKR